MSASQLLRILQTRPVGTDDEMCVFSMDGLDERERSMNRSPKCTNPFLSNEEDNNVNFWNNPEHETSFFWNDFTNSHKDHETIRESTTARNEPSQLFEKSNGFYIDKHSVECELPELIVCYKENDFRVKDICIDEGTPNDDTLSINNDNHGNNDDDDDDMICASLIQMSKAMKWLRSPASVRSYMDANTIVHDDVSTDKQDWSLTSLEFPEPASIYAGDVDQQPFQNCAEDFSKRAIVGFKAEKQGRDDQRESLLRRSEIEETQESVTFHFDTRKPATGSDPCRAMSPESVMNFLSDRKFLNTRMLESRMSAMQNMKCDKLESQVSPAGVHFLELITCSRPNAIYWWHLKIGQIAVQQSTNPWPSPLLETESISSPVKMVKAERRHEQKQKRWRQGLICCRF
ncbi:starmaker-like protein [Tanacetum coccineum]